LNAATREALNVHRRRVVVLSYFVSALIVLYWVAWFAHRSLVATSTAATYTNFEQAFPLADGLIVVWVLFGARALKRRSSLAVPFFLLGAGAGFYLGAMDVLFDLEHGVWAKGANGLVELAINVATFTLSSYFARWAWTNRRELDPGGDGVPACGQ